MPVAVGTVSWVLLRGLAYCPAIRPTFTTGHARAVREHDRHREEHADLVSDLLGATATRTSRRSRRPGAGTRRRVRPRRGACRRRSHSLGATSGGSPASSAPTARTAAGSGQAGCWPAGRVRQESITCSMHPAYGRDVLRSPEHDPSHRTTNASAISCSNRFPSSSVTDTRRWGRSPGSASGWSAIAVQVPSPWSPPRARPSPCRRGSARP